MARRAAVSAGSSRAALEEHRRENPRAISQHIALAQRHLQLLGQQA